MASAPAAGRNGELPGDGSADRCLFPLRPGGRAHASRVGGAAIVSFTRYLKVRARRSRRALAAEPRLHAGRAATRRTCRPQYLLKPELFKSEAPMPAVHGRRAGRRSSGAQTSRAARSPTTSMATAWSTSSSRASTTARPCACIGTAATARSRIAPRPRGCCTQLGGINAIQTDYNNDGRLDIFIMRGGWEVRMRNSLLRNNGDGTFTDVTREAGLLDGEAGHALGGVGATTTTTAGWTLRRRTSSRPASCSGTAATARSRM